MRTIILPTVQKTTILIKDLSTKFDPKINYICYITSSDRNRVSVSGTGVAFLLQQSDGQWGFVYHKNVISGRIQNAYLTFCRRTLEAAVTDVINTNKDVFFVETYSEFLDLCKQYQKY